MPLIGPISGSDGLSSVIGITGSLDITYDGEANEDGWIQMTEVTAPGNPDANKGRIYVADDSGTTKLYFKDSDGTATSLLGGGGSGTITALNNQTANRLVTIGSTTTELDGEAGLTYDGTDLTIASSTASKPILHITNTHAGATSGEIRFNKDSASGDDSDVMGKISFYGTDAGEATHEELAYIDAIITDSAAGSEAASLRFYVAENDGNRTAGLTIAGQADDDGEVDVTIGAGVGSTTTIAGSIGWGNGTGLSGAGASQGDVVYFASTSVVAGKIYWYDGVNWQLADATGPASQPIKLLAVALATGTASAVGMLLRGMVILSQDPLLSDSGEVLYISETAGVATADASTLNTTGNIVRVIGYSLHVSSGLIYFNPDQTWVVIA